MFHIKDNIQNWHKKADNAFQLGEYIQYREILEGIVEQYSSDGMAYLKLGYLYMRTDTPTEALGYLQKAMQLNPESAETHKALGYYYRLQKNWNSAIEFFLESISIEGEKPQVLEVLFEIYSEIHDWESALLSMEKLLKLVGNNVEYFRKYAQVLKKLHRDRDTFQAYNTMMQYYHNDLPDEDINLWMVLSKKFGKTDKTRELLRDLRMKDPDNIRLMYLYGRSCEADDDSKEALSVLKQAQQKDPDNTLILHSLAGLYRVLGDMPHSLIYYKKILSIDPFDISALSAIGSQHSYMYGDDLFKQLNYAASQMADLSDVKKVKLHYALGKAYDDVSELDTAFEHYKLGGVLHSQGRHMEEVANLQLFVNHIKKSVNSQVLEKYFLNNINESVKNESKKAVFIVGMPRSGTTLMEQVLSGLNGICGAGELKYLADAFSSFKLEDLTIGHIKGMQFDSLDERGEYYLKKISDLAPVHCKKIVDKMPDNFRLAGLIKTILPEASIIYAKRHPVEICLSAYRLSFGMGHFWSDDLQAMGKYFRAHSELMQHWKNILPANSILEVRYEDMVSDLEVESKRISKYIDVDWKPECLSFYEREGAVRTASVSQVRQPLYKSSMNRWKKYEKQLAPLLNEIGDLVEIYEKELIEG